jgi:tRNA threonylcarbamoyl adenosine modification protein YeaZ
MIVLALDTALAACSVALYDARRDLMLAARYQAIARGHAELLPAMIEAVMAECDLAMGSIDRIVVTRGPGTFTGVRIGLATARGLALALDRPVCGITTLEALAAAASTSPANTACLACAIDARRGEVYRQDFGPDGTPLNAARLVTVEAAAEQVPPDAVLVGNGSAVLIAAGCDRQLASAPSLPDAAAFVRRAARLVPEAAPAEPLYLRAPDAKAQMPFVATSQAPIAVIDAGPAQAGILAGLHASAFVRAWSATEIATLLSAPGAIALMAVTGTAGREPVGFVLARHAADEAEILTICTRPAARRRGVARQLMSCLIGLLPQHGATSLFLEVDAGNQSALGLYRGLGFSEAGRRTGYYGNLTDGGSDALVMRRQLQAAQASLHPGAGVPIGEANGSLDP